MNVGIRVSLRARLKAVLLVFSLVLLSLSVVGCPSEEAVSVPYGCEACLDFSGVTSEAQSKAILDKSRCAVKPGGSEGQCLVCRLDEHCQSPSAPTKKCTEKFTCICGSDKDCPKGQFCLGKQGCVQCLKDDDCKDRAKNFCVNNRCDGECKAGSTRPCVKDGACNGIQRCTSFGIWKACESSGGKPEKELCDDRDNDCDGLVDEDFPQVGKSCNETVGICNVSGKWACKPDFKGVVCKGDAKGKTKETCNGKDDDCNGVIDDNLTAPPCDKQAGVCKGSVKVCGGEKGWLPCTDKDYAKHSSDYNAKFDGQTAASCDGIDNNCDGKVDEAPPEGAETCENKGGGGVGECKKGRITCKDKKTVCSPGVPTKERCDGKDNDCNGKIDELFFQIGKPCAAGQGGCREEGKFVCKKDGSGTECGAKGKAPVPEACNKKDDDCDGLVDEGLDGQNCTVGTLKGDCNEGQARCTDGVLSCVQVNQPRPEVVDKKDNDCDGFIDEGIIDTVADFSKTKVVLRGMAINYKQELFVSDGANHTLLKVDIATGKYTQVAGISGTGSAVDDTDPKKSTFKAPAQLTFDPTGTHLYIADQGNSLIRRMDGISGEVSTYVKSTEGSFGLAFNTKTTLYFHNAGSLYSFDTKSVRATVLTRRHGGPSYGVYGVAGDSLGNLAYTRNSSQCTPHIYCKRSCRGYNCHALTYTPGGVNLGGTCASNCSPRGATTFYTLLAAYKDQLYAVVGGTRIFKIAEKGKVLSKFVHIAGDPAKKGTSFGDKRAAVYAGFHTIRQMAFDKQGNLYIADEGNKSVRVIKAPL